MSEAPGGPAMSFAAFVEWYIVYRNTRGSGRDYDWLAKMPRINFGDYTDFFNGAAMMRGLLTHDSYREYDCALFTALKHATQYIILYLFFIEFFIIHYEMYRFITGGWFPII